MKKLLTLPPNLVENFHQLCNLSRDEWFVASDPSGRKVGSGGGTVALVENYVAAGGNFSDRKIIIHACGESRRLPAYASVGKVLTPVPVFRWANGQHIDQTLLSLQIPLYEEIMERAPKSLTTLIASGDVYIHAPGALDPIPKADIVCYGLWADAALASHHGVFVLDRKNTNELEQMLQKPSVEKLAEISQNKYFLMDIGVWLLSDKAMKLLAKRSHSTDGNITAYDLYSDFGCALGNNPQLSDPEVNSLSVAVIPMTAAEFYHFGTSRELISSTLALQSKVSDQRLIFHNKIKPHPALFTQNCIMHKRLESDNSEVWVENSFIAADWTLTSRNIVTGIPEGMNGIKLAPGQCLDVVPIGETKYAVRPYGFTDLMSGDEQFTPRYPVVDTPQQAALAARYLLGEESLAEGKQIVENSPLLSASELSAQCNLKRLFAQKAGFLKQNISQLAANHAMSVFYQLDLDNLASTMKSLGVDAPDPLPSDAPIINRSRCHMLRARIADLNGKNGHTESQKAFELLRESVLAFVDNSNVHPCMDASPDQIIWARSPVRIDLAGGWTDTPPYSLTNGANVVNMAVELNSQPPLQTFIKPCSRPHIVLRSIDMGATETVATYQQLTDFQNVGSPFSIPKAALALAGFYPTFSPHSYPSLARQLEEFGCGMEITLLSAVPAGSGLGTSSILASTVLAAISEFCGLAWDKTEICRRTLALEQLLTTGGGWQDQYGGVLRGVKLLQTQPGFDQTPLSRWLPDSIFTSQDTHACHLLYYTGLTRTAKNILSEIVRGMFLNHADRLRTLEKMKAHALAMADAIQRSEFQRFGSLVAETWKQNQLLDSGTNPPAVAEIINKVNKYCLGLKLPGAGGGGFLYMVARDPEAAAKIREILTSTPPNPRARFVDMSLSNTGLQTSRS